MSRGRECNVDICVSYDYTWQLVGRQVSGGGKDKQIARNGGKASQGKIVCFFVLVRGHVFVRVLADIGIFFFGGSGDS